MADYTFDNIDGDVDGGDDDDDQRKRARDDDDDAQKTKKNSARTVENNLKTSPKRMENASKMFLTFLRCFCHVGDVLTGEINLVLR